MKVIRSYTFRATLSLKTWILLRSYVPLRSVYVPQCFFDFLSESYTFLYVPCNPLAKNANSITFLYVPLRSAYVPHCFLNFTVRYTFLYVSYTFLSQGNVTKGCVLACWASTAVSNTFLYVPDTFLCVPWTPLARKFIFVENDVWNWRKPLALCVVTVAEWSVFPRSAFSTFSSRSNMFSHAPLQ